MKILLDKNDPILRQTAELVKKVDFDSLWLKELINDLFMIMESTGAVGVAAPQIGVSKRVIVFGTAYSKYRQPETEIPNTALVNPSFRIISNEKQIGQEGCLNCGDLIGDVSRGMKIEYSGFDLKGNYITKQAKGLEARILQHEVDHLNGLLFLDHVINKESIKSISKINKIK